MSVQQFKALHQDVSTPLLLCNVWDAVSAQTAEKLGFKAIGTSSAAVANMLGYQDGEALSFEELFFIVKRIRAASKLPLTVDIEAGYSDDAKITAVYIKQLADIGVVGINIEDSKVTDNRYLSDTDSIVAFLTALTGHLKDQNVDIYINVRTDTYLLNVENALEQTLTRIEAYANAGADGIFVPCVTALPDISAITSATDLPVNVMCMPELSQFDHLAKAGVRRLSMGNFLFEKMHAQLSHDLNEIRQTNSFASVF